MLISTSYGLLGGENKTSSPEVYMIYHAAENESWKYDFFSQKPQKNSRKRQFFQYWSKAAAMAPTFLATIGKLPMVVRQSYLSRGETSKGVSPRD